MDALINSINEILDGKKKLSEFLPCFSKFDLKIDNCHVSFNNNYYSRNLVYRNDKFDIYYICWKKNQKSKIHSHPNNGCLMKVLMGKVKECKYSNNINLEKISEKELNVNDCGYMEGSKLLHDIEALEDTISLHIYSPPKFTPIYY